MSMGERDNSRLKKLFLKHNKDIVEPMDYKLIYLNEPGYKILTKERYIERKLCKIKASNQTKEFIEELNKTWYILSKGYEFAILANDMIYSVDYFNSILSYKENID